MKKLDKRLAQLSENTFIEPKTARVRMQELFDDVVRDYRKNGHKSLAHAQRRWDLHVRPFFGVLRAVDVGSDLIARYDDSRQQAGASRAEIRTVPMTRNLAVLLSAMVMGKGREDHVFTREDGKPVRTSKKRGGQSASQLAALVCFFYDLRRTAVRNMIRKGIPKWSPCASPATRRAPFSTATTSPMKRTCRKLPGGWSSRSP